MKKLRLTAFLLILSLLFTLCSCAKKEDEDSAIAGEVTVDSNNSEQTGDNTQTPSQGNSQNTNSTADNNTSQTPSDGNTPSGGNTPSDNKTPETNKTPENNNGGTSGSGSGQSTPSAPTAEIKNYNSAEKIPYGKEVSLFCYSGNLSHTAVFDKKNEEFYNKYISALKKEGFKMYSESDFSKSGKKNLFATYQTDDNIVDIGYHSAAGRIFVTFTPKEKGLVLHNTEKPKYTDCGMPTIITQVGAERFHPTAVSMCYIIRLADGTFIVYDSDFGDGMAELIYDVLKKQAPDPDNIVISAWFVTHPHLDHVGAFIDFADKYAGDKTITLKQMVYNYSSDSHVGSTAESLMRKTPIAAKKLNPDVTFVRPHAGNVLRYADVTFRVLYTQEEYLFEVNGKVEDQNACTVVTQMETDSGVKIFLGGDHPVSEGEWEGIPFCQGALYKWYGEFIRSDVLTHLHHGFGGGANLELLKTVRPKIVLWPAGYYRLTRDENGTPYGNIEFNSLNSYFTNPDNAKNNGVIGYYISGDKIQIMDLSNKDLKVTEYSHCDEYLKK